MSNISDVIEQFILQNLGEDLFLDLSRNELAEFFKVAPSQINYVLSTRFNFERGFSTQSRRGGGGFIRLCRLNLVANDYVKDLYNLVGEEIDFMQASSILCGLCDNGIITEGEKDKLLAVISPKALSAPIKIEHSIRAKMIKNLLMSLMTEGRYE